MRSVHEEEFGRQVNEALRRGRGIRVGPSMSESRRRVNDAIREQAAAGTWEHNATTGEVTHRDGKPVEGE
jgi:hypothetical protein